MVDEEPSQVSCAHVIGGQLSHTIRASSPMLLRQEAWPTLLSEVASEGQGQLSILLRPKHGLRWQPRPGTSAWFLVVIQATDINKDPVCNWTMDPDMTLGSSMGPNAMVALSSNSGHSDYYGPMRQHGPQTFTWLLLVVQTMDISMALGDNLCHDHQYKTLDAARL